MCIRGPGGRGGHWLTTYMATIIIFLCPIVGCDTKSPRPDKIKDHFKRSHQKAVNGEDDRRVKLRFLPWIEEVNNDYIAPGDALPPAGFKVLKPIVNPTERYPPVRTKLIKRSQMMPEEDHKSRKMLLHELNTAQEQISRWSRRATAIKQELKKREIEQGKSMKRQLDEKELENKKLKAILDGKCHKNP